LALSNEHLLSAFMIPVNGRYRDSVMLFISTILTVDQAIRYHVCRIASNISFM